jgi:predicted acylesterase/phospholipase RssA
MQNVEDGDGRRQAGADAGAPQEPRECDLVMKGGITSGIVYPPLVIKLHDAGYSFRKVGGTSAGAIAAAVTAAAEHGKQSGGFEKLNAVREWLGSDGNLLHLFQPSRKTAALMNTLLGYAELKWLRWAPLRAVAAAVLHDLLFFVAGAAAGVGVAFAFAWLVGGSLAGRGAVAALISALLFGALAVALHLLWILLAAVPANGFGLCTGRGANLEGLDKTVLTDWLHFNLNDIAGMKAGARDAPLTFRDLWGTGAHEPKARRVDLRMMTSDLSQNQPYVLPFEKSTFVFKSEEMRRLFPPGVVEHMEAKARTCEGVRLPEGYHFLPGAKDLPVVVATRMSLSFPVLISMAPLYTVSQKAFEGGVRCEVVEEPDPDREGETRERIVFSGWVEGAWHTPAGEDARRLRPEDLQRNWFSDGGICSNFPIQFFDAFLPTRPTFGVNLTSQLAEGTRGEEVTEKIKERSSVVAQPAGAAARPDDRGRGAPESARDSNDVYLPHADETIPPQWVPLEGLGAFLESIFRTAQNYRDNMQAMLPSYRERIVQIRLTDEEGGLNLNMDEATIRRVVKKGEEAGQLLLTDFDMPAHEWTRFRVLMKQVEARLKEMVRTLDTYPFYMNTLANPPLNPDFPFQRDPGWLGHAHEQLSALIALVESQRPPDLFAGDPPLPEPVLRVTPEI